MKLKPRLLKLKGRRNRPAPTELRDQGSAKRMTRGFTTGFTSEPGFPPYIRWQ